VIGRDYGKQYLPDQPNVFKTKQQGAQEAHEAIRPTEASRHPDTLKKYLHEDEMKVYKLIWQRFLASQMAPAIFDRTTVDSRRAHPGKCPAGARRQCRRR